MIIIITTLKNKGRRGLISVQAFLPGKDRPPAEALEAKRHFAPKRYTVLDP